MSNNKREFDRFRSKMDSFADTFRAEVEEILERNAQEAATYAKTRAPKHDGDLQNSIRVIEEPERNSEGRVSRSVIADISYAPYVEFGTKKRASPPPEWADYANDFRSKERRTGAYERIMAWAKSKGFDEESSQAIFFSIMKHGIDAQPYMYPAFIQQKRKLINELKKLL